MGPQIVIDAKRRFQASNQGHHEQHRSDIILQGFCHELLHLMLGFPQLEHKTDQMQNSVEFVAFFGYEEDFDGELVEAGGVRVDVAAGDVGS